MLPYKEQRKMKKKLVLFGFALVMFGAQAQDQPVTKLTPQEYVAKQKKEKGVVLDVRTPEEFAQGHLKQAKNSDYKNGQFEQELSKLDKNKTYYLYCATGNRSGKALKLMQEAGFKNVYNVGGYKDLEAAGVPVKKPKQK